MKTIHKFLTISLLFSFLLLLSCNRPHKEIFRYIPETAMAVITFHPGNLLDKGKIRELNFLREEWFENKIAAKIINDPENSGIHLDRYAAAFIAEGLIEYDCLMLPIQKKSKFEQALFEIEREEGLIRESGKMKESFDVIKLDNHLIVYGTFVALVFYDREREGMTKLETIANQLLDLEKEFSILADKDFNNFLGKQKDLNAWFNSSNLKGIPLLGNLSGGMDELSGLNNNYGHVFIGFQKGNMTLSTNLRFNQSMQTTIDKFNFLDEKAIKELLNYLPSKDLVFILNTNLNPEKIFDLLKFVNHDFESTLDQTIESLNMDPEEVKNAVSGEFALSFHGLKNSESLNFADSTDLKNIPFIVTAFRIKDKVFFDKFLSIAEHNPDVAINDGYYTVYPGVIPIYLILQGKDMILSNEEPVIKEIAARGEVEQNVTRTEYEPVLIKNTVCFYLNLDKRSYSRETGDYLQNEMGSSISSGFETFGDQLKSLTFSASLEEWEIRLDLRDTDEYSLYTLLSEMDKNE